MKLEDQVVSLDLAKRLKELGVRQRSYAYWADDGNGWGVWDQDNNPKFFKSGSKNVVAAFTVAELGQILPAGFTGYRTLDGKWHCFNWGHSPVEKPNDDFSADTEADARAKMLIYLIEEGLVKP